MADLNQIKSKVLTFDTDITVLPRLKTIFEANNLTGMRSIGDASVVNVILDKNIHLGALFVNNRGDWLKLSRELKKLRPELPLFLRVEEKKEEKEISKEDLYLFDCIFHISQEEKISSSLNTHIFIRDYPVEMIRHIHDFSMNALKYMIPEADVHSPAPLVVRDQVIYGEITSLIPVNTNWCRGYMMLQSDMKELHSLLKRTGNPTFKGDLEEVVPPVIGELTNLMWGGFKTVFLKEGFLEETGPDIQVPILVNHRKKNISFGGDIPQLCFEYILKDPMGLSGHTKLVQKFIFNLNWNPDLVKEYDFESLVEQGSIELF
ncbi:MAG: chemotaxis protein CheX [Spirochaetales bacterium]|nr:chemotaxis protein CheX [Spirochaetales bacterium]